MVKKRAIVWFREDLRLHDNEAITEAVKGAEEVLFVYVFDERTFKGKTRWFGFPKTGKFRAQFILESVVDLRENLRKKGAELIVKIGKPEDELAKLADETQSSWVFCNRERMQEEELVQDTLEKNLWSIGREMRYSRGKMLYHTQDLPFPVHHTPDIFTQFRKEVEKIVKVRPPLPLPDKFAPLSIKIEAGTMPTLEDFGHQPFEQDERAALIFKGGETEALKRLHYYLEGSKLAKTYKETRNGLLGGDYSTKFSVWLAHGCISPKKIYQELQTFERNHGSNESTYWIFFELLWRDFFRLMGKKYNNKIFLKNGPIGEVDKRWKNDSRLFELWAKGKTGIPFIDANMIELQNTGFMSNRGRQNVASFLIKDLFVNWQMGAEYFESILLDYDPCSNWGNWNYMAGVGSDPRENRYFNILRQAKMYDPKGDYVKHWLPVLKPLPENRVHQPEQLSFKEQTEFGIKIGANYPKPMINTKKWEK
jgi:deoxyribodipyrimidine photo-lyase